MTDQLLPRLSEIATASSDRRGFFVRASAISLAIPGIGAALSACTPGEGERAAGTASAGAGLESAGARTPVQDNSNSRLDSAVLKDGHAASTSATADAVRDAQLATFRRYDPALPPLSGKNRLQLSWHARETPVRINDDTVVAGWTFEGDIPGPIVHCRVGDTVDFTLTNDVIIPHSMDFHAARIDPKIAFAQWRRDSR